MRRILLALCCVVTPAVPMQAAGARGPNCWAETSQIAVCAAYNAYVSEQLRRVMPASSNLGEGQASCSFRVVSGGRITNVSCSGTSDEHASTLRQIVDRLRLKSPPGPWARYSQTLNFH